MRRITLQEPDTAPISAPTASVSEDGRFLVPQLTEGKVRIYSPSGQLLQTVGRRGEGPEELLAPVDAELRNDELWVLDVQGGLSRWGLAGDSAGLLLSRLPSPYSFSVSLEFANDSTLLLGGVQPADEPWFVLSMLNPETGEVEASIVEHSVPPESRGLALTVTSVPIHVGGRGRGMAMHGWSDTLKIFDVESGAIVDRMHLPIPGFTYEGSVPTPETLQALRIVRKVAGLPGGGIVVQYGIPTMDQEGEEYGLLLVDSAGGTLDERFPVPRLLDVSGSELFFADSTGLRPGEIVVMTYR